MIKLIATKSSFIIFILITLIACTEQKEKRIINFSKTDLAAGNFIPKPLRVMPTHGGFALDELTTIHTSENFEELGKFLAGKINSKTNLSLQVNTDEIPNIETVIYIKKTDILNPDEPEAYQLHITSDSVILISNTAAGAFRGMQTFRQLIPETSNDTLAQTKIWTIPTGEIIDNPQFKYRGAMLDVARHFFSVQDVKKFIDLLAYYKYNALHMHLSDDQGWRIEIKSWLMLTETGGSTEVGDGPASFYTQEEYTDIVNYTAENHMIIVPEIDMPEHTNAASVSYPFLNGNGKTLSLYTGTEVGFSTFDTRKDTVYAFIDDVVCEIANLSSGPYFHIGGDESHVTKKSDYLFFVNKMEKIVQKYGKRLIGWDEVATTDLDATSISQFWRNKENAQTAVKKGMKIILSPASKAYLDMKHDPQSKHGLNWAGYIPTDTAYIWSPETYSGVPVETILVPYTKVCL